MPPMPPLPPLPLVSPSPRLPVFVYPPLAKVNITKIESKSPGINKTINMSSSLVGIIRSAKFLIYIVNNLSTLSILARELLEEQQVG
jgi:hypothetical protein